MNFKLLLRYLFFTTIFFNQVLTHVRKFNQMDFDKWLNQENLLVVLFCSSMTDNSCIKEREKMNILSNQMYQNNDIVFGYIDKESDPILISRYDVQKFPMIKFFPYNNPSENYFLNIRIPDLKNKILEIKQKYSEKVKSSETTTMNRKPQKRIFISEIDWIDFPTTVKDPERHAILILYDGDCNEICRIMERIAKIFQEDNEIGFYKIKLENTGHLREALSFSRNPTIFWYPKNQKDGFVYGGKITLEVFVEYVNDHAGLSRNLNGDLKHNAGRIAAIDQIIQENILSILLKTNLNYVIHTVQSKIKDLPHSKKYIDYYLAILKEMRKAEDPDQVLLREQDFLNKRLSQSSLNNKELDDWRKYYNIISAFIEYAANRLQEDRAKKSPPKEVPNRVSKKVENRNKAQLKIDSKWKGGWKQRSRHDEL